MFRNTLTTAALSLFSFAGLARLAAASPCLAFDADMNLIVFGLDGKDWNAGQQDGWTGTSAATDITADGRPPFDGDNTTCYLAQFYNAIYVMNGDKANPSSVSIYNAAQKSWSTQSVTTGTFDPSNFATILDHDTNVFYAVSNGELFFLDMGSLVTANSSAVAWTDVEKLDFATSDYKPVMALAQNHIHFLDVPNVPAGSAQIFVIHFSFLQPDAQAYTGATFPAQHGQATSFFQSTSSGGVQQEFAFIPDDGSATYVINVENNSTTQLAGPSTKDSSAQYFAGVTALVQLTSGGEVNFLPYQQGQASTNAAAAWAPVARIAAAAPASSTAASGTGSGTAKATGTSKTSATGKSGSSTASGASASSTDADASGAAGVRVAGGMAAALVLGAVALLV